MKSGGKGGKGYIYIFLPLVLDKAKRFDFEVQELAGVGRFFRPFTVTPVQRSFPTYSCRAAELEIKKEGYL